MVDNHQNIIIDSPKVPYYSLTSCKSCYEITEKNVDFDTFDSHVMVNFIEPNLKEIIFTPSRVGLITQK
jgi:bisphosphoglycerate-independent phosphoglycerate mutase (AlkP superfamily)